MEFIPAKSIVTKSKNAYWFGSEYNMNIYKGCCHGCIYCDSRSECYRIDDFDTVRAKDNAVEIIEHELQRKKIKGVIATGAMSDPYNPFEKEYELTRRALKVVDQFQFGVAIDTKSDLIVRDIDLLTKIKRYSPVLVKITITTADDELAKKIEPNVCLSSERFFALRRLSEAGIYCGILLMPLLPFINDTEENIRQIVHLAKINGARFIFPAFGVTLRQNQRIYFYEKLNEKFPGITEKYIERYNNTYSCQSPNAKTLSKIFVQLCKENGIIYKMEDIVKTSRDGYYENPPSFFDVLS